MAKEANPIPQGKYVPATRFGNMIFTAGPTYTLATGLISKMYLRPYTSRSCYST